MAQPKDVVAIAATADVFILTKDGQPLLRVDRSGFIYEDSRVDDDGKAHAAVTAALSGKRKR